MNAVVLPKPAGAEMRPVLCIGVSLRCSPVFNRSIRRGRETSLVLSPVEGSGRTGGYRVWWSGVGWS